MFLVSWWLFFREVMTMRQDTIGKVTERVKIAAGLFWADYGILGAQVEELTAAGVDWIHIEMRDGKYMDFQAPRGGVDIVEAARAHTDLEVEVQLQMMRPSQELFRMLRDAGADLISLPIETTGETLIQSVSYIKETLGLKVGVWAWQGCPLVFFDQYLPFVDIIEYESRAPFWAPLQPGKSPHTIDPIVIESMGDLHKMIVARGRAGSRRIDGGRRAERREHRAVRRRRDDGGRVLVAAAQGAGRQAARRHGRDHRRRPPRPRRPRCGCSSPRRNEETKYSGRRGLRFFVPSW